ncbi:MAG: tyramine oxidase [Xanthobacteraceae bacterium]
MYPFRPTAAFLSLFMLAGPAMAQTHPMDALTADEIKATAAILRADPRTKEAAYQLITLKEMPKADVLAWAPGKPLQRMARVTAVAGTKVIEADVNLGSRAITGIVERSGIEAPLTLNEFTNGVDVALQNPEFLAALAKRGITDPKKIYCAPFSAGNYGIREHEGKRLLKVGCFDTSRSTNNLFGWPIERLYALVELREKRVLRVVDDGVVPLAEQDMNFTEEAIKPLREPRKPVQQAAPNGPNVRIDGGEVSWGNWRFHVRLESRQGTVISLARWNDGGRQRSVLYQGYMSEMFVPYMDADYGWYSRTYFDMGEYGLGLLASPLKSGIDCPAYAVFLKGTLNDDRGEPDERPNAICIFERATGEPAWRHYEIGNQTYEGRPGVELVVRMASQLGNYDYLIDWVFNDAGEIEGRIGATGIDALKGVAAKTMRDPTAKQDTRYGTLVAPGLVAVQHDHFFNYRLDFDVDGPTNTFQKDVYKTLTLPPSSPRRSIYTVSPEKVDREGPVLGTGHEKTMKLRIVNEAAANSMGNPVSYEIVYANHGHLIIDRDDWPARRSAFLQSDMWVTPYDEKQRYAGGDYLFASKAVQGLPEWTKAARAVRNKDIVVWLNIGMHHLTRAEDLPVMPMVWHSFRLRPFNFFDRNPAVDLRTDFAK